jgi:GGDEF domain-containing protein
MIIALRKPIQVQGNEVFIGGSFGCAEYPNQGEDELVLLKCADAAMYQAKACGGNTYVVYDSGAMSVPASKGDTWTQY